jgi:phosphate transport system substrate-binding protein
MSVRRAIPILIVLATLMGASGPVAMPTHDANRQPSASVPLRQTASQVELAIIVNKSNPNDNLSFSELREYFMAERNNWSSGAGKVRVIMREPGDAEREAVLRVIYDMDEKGFNSYFLGKKFRGEILEEPRLRTSTPDMIKTIANVPGSIGYVRADEVDASVKVIRVDGLAPGDAGYRIKQ